MAEHTLYCGYTLISNKCYYHIRFLFRWETLTEFPQERSSVNLMSSGRNLYAVGGFAIVELESKEVGPSEMTDVWQYVVFCFILL